MKVCIVTPAYPTPGQGKYPGIERYSQGLARGFEELNDKVKIVTTFWNGGSAVGEDNGIEVRRYRDLRTRLRRAGRASGALTLDQASLALSIFQDESALESDLVLFNVPFPLLHLLKRDWVALRVLHHMQPIDRLASLLTVPFEMVQDRMTGPDSYVAHSAFAARTYSRFLGVNPGAIKLVPEGVDSHKFSPDTDGRKILQKYAGKRLILYVGPLEPDKQVGMLIRIFKRITGTISDCHLLIVGKGSEVGRLRTQAIKLGLGTSVHFEGYVNEHDLPLYYAASEVFVTASRIEGFGLVLLEAMASGVPVVAFNVASIPEVVSDCGLLVKPFDESSFAEKVISLLKSAEIHDDLVQRSILRARLFTWGKTARKISEYAVLAR